MRLWSDMKKGVLASTLLALLLLAGKCGDDELDFSTDATADNVCGEVAEVMCSNIFQCCRGGQIESSLGVEITTDEKACRRDVRLICEEETAIVQASVDAGRASWRIQQINECLKAAVAPKDGCFPYVADFLPQCVGPMYQGRQVAGAECLHDYECIEDHYCGVDRKCKAYPVVGQSCEQDGICASTAYCDSVETADGSYQQLCVAKKAAGVGCNNASECLAGLLCFQNPNPVVGDEFFGICTARRAVGEPCDQNAICESNRCLPGMCNDGSGECYTDADCGGYCEMSGGSCSSLEPCASMCEESGNYCDAENPCYGSCAQTGDFCYEDDDCYYGSCAISGYTCTDDYDCQDNTGDTCVPDTCELQACLATDVCVGMSTCGGTPVCAESFSTANYCQLNLIAPLSSNGGEDIQTVGF